MNKPKVAIGFMALLSLIVLAVPSLSAVDLTGTWTGSFDMGNNVVDTFTLVLKKADISYTGTINDSMSLVDKDFAITEVKLVGSEFSFAFKVFGGGLEMAMKLTVNGDKMVGKLVNKAEEEEVPFEFVRKK